MGYPWCHELGNLLFRDNHVELLPNTTVEDDTHSQWLPHDDVLH